MNIKAHSLNLVLKKRRLPDGFETRASLRGDATETIKAFPWLCPHCGRPAVIEDVDWSADGERRLTFWSCPPCQVAAVTPSDLREPPTGWVRRTEQ
jgi:hypothetical protein